MASNFNIRQFSNLGKIFRAHAIFARFFSRSGSEAQILFGWKKHDLKFASIAKGLMPKQLNVWVGFMIWLLLVIGHLNQQHSGCYCGCDLNWGIFFIDIDECSTNNGGCSHHCYNIPGSFYCGCPEGTTMASNNLTCVGKCGCLS